MIINKAVTIYEKTQIPIPFYFKKNDNDFFKVMDENKVMNVWVMPPFSMVKLSTAWNLTTDIGNSVEITREEFDAAYEKAISIISSLEPALP